MLSLINVEINANVDRFENTMWKAADIADASMVSAAANADRFQTAFDRAAVGVSQSTDRMAGYMEAANDRIVNASDEAAQSLDSINQAAEKIDTRSWGEKIAAGFGAGVGVGAVAATTWLDKLQEFASAKMKAIGIGLAIGLVSAGAAAIYTAYRIASGALDFIGGLFTGESYKSENIDALIALNNEVKDLQKNLGLTSIQASALNEALKGAGVSRSDYISTMEAASKAAHTNTDELDRLGVKYKGTNQVLLTQTEILQNVKSKLEEYSAGYDRNAAAAAMGVGSYEKVIDALSVTGDKVSTARERLIDYGLIIGPGTQAAVTQYETAMRAFQRESDLTAQGFKTAIADAVMPILTDLATLLQDGFPGAVKLFRVATATMATLMLGLEESVYIAYKGIEASFQSLEVLLIGGALAITKMLTGEIDNGGAAKIMATAWEDASKRFGRAGDDIIEKSKKIAAENQLAWGVDPAALDSALGIGDVGKTPGKSWVPKPTGENGKTLSAPADPNNYNSFVERLQRENAALDQNQYAMLRLEAVQKGFNQEKDLSIAMGLIEQRQILDSTKAIRDFSTKLDEENIAYEQKRAAIGKVGIELDLYNMREQKRLEAISKINEAERAGKPLTDDARIAILDRAEASVTAAEAILRENSAIERSFEVGASKAFSTYLDNATNAAKGASDLFTNSFSKMEDALVNFAKTGKLDFKSLADSIITDLIRIQARAAMTNALNSVGGSGGVLGLIGSLFGGGSNAGAGTPVANTPSTYSTPIADSMSGISMVALATGTDYVPQDMIALIHKGEQVVPAAYNPTTNGTAASMQQSSVTVNVINHSGAQASTQERSDGKGNRIIDVIIEQAKNAIAADLSTGNGAVPAAMSGAYGLQRRAGAY
jgi:hypothetical protein